ncbi:MAG: DUF4199 domain-containing protein [Bacteroidetes bacterium]|nr:DUF4199 domain-containing protein [Bacteroidota bacterium]MBS1670454.1 DUF4199 domain-containing protein [Bacteroidota bacterium]
MSKNINTGIKFGLGIGLLYVVLLFLRWGNAAKPFSIGIIAIASYLLIIGILFWEATLLKKNNGGFISMKQLFQSLFITVLIFELFYSIYNFIHFKYIDPNIIAKMQAGAAEAFKSLPNVSEKDKQAAIANYSTLTQYTQPLKMLQSYISSIAVSGSVVALISFIMKKNTTVAN